MINPEDEQPIRQMQQAYADRGGFKVVEDGMNGFQRGQVVLYLPGPGRGPGAGVARLACRIGSDLEEHLLIDRLGGSRHLIPKSLVRAIGDTLMVTHGRERVPVELVQLTEKNGLYEATIRTADGKESSGPVSALSIPTLDGEYHHGRKFLDR